MAQVQPTPPAAGPEVTLKGVMMTEASCLPKGGSPKTPVLFVVEGTPEVAATLDAIMKENWPGDSMDGDQAKALNEAFIQRLKYYIVPGEITERKENNVRYGHPGKAVTGVLSEKDGKKWITPSKIEPTKLKYPEKMLTPDKPFVMPGKEPLMLKVTDTLSLKCILLPAGKLLARDPFYLAGRYDDPYPFLATLTKPFYLAEIPVTQEMYESVMANNPSEQKDPQVPVTQVPYTDILKFCQVLSEKNGRKVRLPTECEWEYAAHVGTSNPAFREKYTVEVSWSPDKTKRLPPVKSKPPNAWGLYDMLSRAWEVTGDLWGPNIMNRSDGIDVRYPADEVVKAGKKIGLCGKGLFYGAGWTLANHEGIGDGSGKGYVLAKFRIAVEATPEEIAKMEKAAKK
jgi:hypothetical protein